MLRAPLGIHVPAPWHSAEHPVSPQWFSTKYNVSNAAVPSWACWLDVRYSGCQAPGAYLTQCFIVLQEILHVSQLALEFPTVAVVKQCRLPCLTWGLYSRSAISCDLHWVFDAKWSAPCSSEAVPGRRLPRGHSWSPTAHIQGFWAGHGICMGNFAQYRYLHSRMSQQKTNMRLALWLYPLACTRLKHVVLGLCKDASCFRHYSSPSALS